MGWRLHHCQPLKGAFVLLLAARELIREEPFRELGDALGDWTEDELVTLTGEDLRTLFGGDRSKIGKALRLLRHLPQPGTSLTNMQHNLIGCTLTGGCPPSISLLLLTCLYPTEPKLIALQEEAEDSKGDPLVKMHRVRGDEDLQKIFSSAGASGICSEDDPGIVMYAFNDLESGGRYRLHFGPKSLVSMLTEEAKESKGFRRNYASAWEEKVSPNHCTRHRLSTAREPSIQTVWIKVAKTASIQQPLLAHAWGRECHPLPGLLQVNLGLPELFAAENLTLIQQPFEDTQQPLKREIDGIFFDAEKSTVVLVECKSGSMKLSDKVRTLTKHTEDRPSCLIASSRSTG